MSELEKELVFSQAVKAGKRIYYFDVKQSRNGDRYISITESKKIVEGTPENPQVSFEKHKLFLYKEDFEKFTNAMLAAIQVAKDGIVPSDDQSPMEPKVPFVAPTDKEKTVEEPVTVVAEASTEKAPIVEETPIVKAKTEESSFKIDLDF